MPGSMWDQTLRTVEDIKSVPGKMLDKIKVAGKPVVTGGLGTVSSWHLFCY